MYVCDCQCPQGHGSKCGVGEWDDFLLQLFPPRFFGVKAVFFFSFSGDKKSVSLKVAAPPIFHFGNRTRNGGYSCEFVARSMYLRTLT